MQTFEQIIEWQNHSFIDALFIDLKMLQFFKVIVPEGTIFTDAVTKELTLEGMRGGGYFAPHPPPLDFSSGFNFFVPWPITESFGTTIFCLLRQFLTLFKWRHDWWRHHNKSRNLCVDY